jgi:hypothetical protein
MLQRVLFRTSGLVALAGLALGLSSAPRAQAADDPAAFRLRITVYELRNAKEDVRGLKGLEDNAKEKTLGAVDNAIDQMKKCAKDAGIDLAYDAPKDKDKAADIKDYHNLRDALREVKAAKGDLRSLKCTDEHRDAALAAMDKAEELLKDALDVVGK